MEESFRLATLRKDVAVGRMPIRLSHGPYTQDRLQAIAQALRTQTLRVRAIVLAILYDYNKS